VPVAVGLEDTHKLMQQAAVQQLVAVLVDQ
jgi:hypothetical protein